MTQPAPADNRILIADIRTATARRFGITVAEMVSERRPVTIARPRQIAMYLSKRLTKNSLPEIGRRFGNRDHTTVLYAVRRIEGLRKADPDIDRAVRSLTRKLRRGRVA